MIPEIDHFSSLPFEEICQQFFWQAGLSGNLSFVPINIGNWWNANEEVDLVVLGENDVIPVECKWTGKPVGIDILAELERKSDLIRPELENRRIRFAICSRSGCTPQLSNDIEHRPEVMLLDLTNILR